MGGGLGVEMGGGRFGGTWERGGGRCKAEESSQSNAVGDKGKRMCVFLDVEVMPCR